MTHWDWQ